MSKRKARQGASKAKPRRLDPEDFASLDDAVEALTGQRPDEAAAHEAAWYQRVRETLRLARDDADKGQADLARHLGIVQSEVSRLETSLGPGTRLGKLRGYLEACAAKMTLRVETAKGTVHAIGEIPEPGGAQAPAPGEGFAVPLGYGMSPWGVMKVTIDDVALQARDLQQLVTVLPALDAAMADAGVSPDQAERIRHCFLERFRQVRGRGQLAAPNRAAFTRQTD